MADDNKKKQNTAETDELTLEEKINKIKSREITEAEKGMLTLPAFEAACEAVKKSKKLLCSQVRIGSQVKQIVSGGRDYEVTVDFENVGTKKMFASFAKLQKI